MRTRSSEKSNDKLNRSFSMDIVTKLKQLILFYRWSLLPAKVILLKPWLTSLIAQHTGTSCYYLLTLVVSSSYVCFVSMATFLLKHFPPLLIHSFLDATEVQREATCPIQQLRHCHDLQQRDHPWSPVTQDPSKLGKEWILLCIQLVLFVKVSLYESKISRICKI